MSIELNTSTQTLASQNALAQYISEGLKVKTQIKTEQIAAAQETAVNQSTSGNSLPPGWVA